MITVEDRKTLDSLLERNYDGLKDRDRECIGLVIEYIRSTESVQREPILFIKRLTKVARLIFCIDQNSLDGLLEKLYQFNKEGVQKLESSGILSSRSKCGFGFTENELLPLRSHLYAHAGDAARAIFDKTGDISWAVRWYENVRMSADISAGINNPKEQRHAAYCYGFAGGAARDIFDKTGDISWAVRWYENKTLSADMLFLLNRNYAAHNNRSAGDAAYALFRITQDREWNQRAIECYKNAIRYYINGLNLRIESLQREVDNPRYDPVTLMLDLLHFRGEMSAKH